MIELPKNPSEGTLSDSSLGITPPAPLHTPSETERGEANRVVLSEFRPPSHPEYPQQRIFGYVLEVATDVDGPAHIEESVIRWWDEVPKRLSIPEHLLRSTLGVPEHDNCKRYFQGAMLATAHDVGYTSTRLQGSTRVANVTGAFANATWPVSATTDTANDPRPGDAHSYLFLDNSLNYWRLPFRPILCFPSPHPTVHS